MRLVRFLADRPPFLAGDEVYVDDQVAAEAIAAGVATSDMAIADVAAAPAVRPVPADTEEPQT